MKLKKLMSTLLVAAMTLSLVACGGKTDDAAADSSSDSTSEVIKIGGIGPTTGGAAIYGQAVENGAQLAVDEINAAGGINGYQVELNFQDDEHDAEKSVNAYNTLKDWGMHALLGSVTSAPCIAVAEYSQMDNVFQLTPSGTAVDCVKYDNAFRVCFSDPTQGTESAKYIADKALASKVAVIYDGTTDYSTGIYQAFAAEAENHKDKFEIVEVQQFMGDETTDFTVQLQKCKDAGAELVFLPFYYSQGILVLQQADNMGYNPIFFGGDGMDGILDVEGFDAALAESLMYMAPFAPTAPDEKIQKFVKAYQEAFDGVPNQFAADAYDGIYAIKAAMEAKNVTPEMSASEICDLLKVAMTEISIDTAVTADVLTWGADGEPVKAPMVVKVSNGEYVVAE